MMDEMQNVLTGGGANWQQYGSSLNELNQRVKDMENKYNEKKESK